MATLARPRLRQSRCYIFLTLHPDSSCFSKSNPPRIFFNLYPVHDEYICLVQGHASVGLRDLRPGSPTFGENEDESPWAPLHAERGLAAGQSAVTVFGAMPMLLVRPSLTAGAEDIVDAAADRLRNSVGVWGGPDRAVDLMLCSPSRQLKVEFQGFLAIPGH